MPIDPPSPTPATPPTPPNPPTPLTASERAALHVREQLQLSGERDHLKERLQRQLGDRGWHADMHARAADIARTRAEEGKKPFTVHELAQQLAEAGHDSIPEPVRAALMNDLLKAARDFAAKTSASQATDRPS